MFFKRKNYICDMEKRKIEIPYEVLAFEELDAKDKELVEAAREATRRSYAPYSRFQVGAAALLENGIIVTGTNQENVASPSGICAERTTLFYANSQYPDVPVVALAITACSADGIVNHAPLSPCGACRQVMLETENRYGKPIRVLLCGAKEVHVVKNVRCLLPFAFENY